MSKPSRAPEPLWITGHNVVESMISRHPDRVIEVWISQTRKDGSQIASKAKKASIGVQMVKPDRMEKQFGDQTHQGIAARITPTIVGDENDLEALIEGAESPFLLILDQVQDPRNFGACLRSAAAAGVDAVVFPRQHSSPISSIVIKTAAGGAEEIALFAVTNLARTMDQLKANGIWTVGAAGEAEKPIWDLDLRGPLAIVMGSEGDGMRRLTREKCDFLAHIPIADSIESLNVSVAAGVLLFEACRQRRQ